MLAATVTNHLRWGCSASMFTVKHLRSLPLLVFHCMFLEESWLPGRVVFVNAHESCGFNSLRVLASSSDVLLVPPPLVEKSWAAAYARWNPHRRTAVLGRYTRLLRGRRWRLRWAWPTPTAIWTFSSAKTVRCDLPSLLLLLLLPLPLAELNPPILTSRTGKIQQSNKKLSIGKLGMCCMSHYVPHRLKFPGYHRWVP